MDVNNITYIHCIIFTFPGGINCPRKVRTCSDKINTMATVITLSRRNWRNKKGNVGAGRPNHNAIKDKPKPGMFYVDQFADWLLGFKKPEVAYPSNTRIDIIKVPTLRRK